MIKRRSINAQYNVADANSIPVRMAAKARRAMFDVYCKAFPPHKTERVLDVGVTSEQTYDASNYFEAWYPHPNQVTAAGLDNAQFLETKYPGMRFIQADARKLPFENGSFDIVHSSAVIEHVGSLTNQQRMVKELCRVARHGVFLTTPNRWFPVEFHTLLPLVHWLPPVFFRWIAGKVRGDFFSREENLNLLTPKSLLQICRQVEGFDSTLHYHRLFGWPSNLLIVMRRKSGA